VSELSQASAEFTVPAVDISAYVHGGSAAERRKTAQLIDEACSSVGFIQVLGHAIPDPAIDGLASAMDAFFGLPLDAKKAYRVAGANRGYSPPKSEALSLSLGLESADRMNDFFEAFNVGVEARSLDVPDLSEEDYGINIWPETTGFTEAVEAYFDHAARVARTLTRIFADALGLDPEFFTRITDHSIDVLRMNNYALPEGTITLDGELTGMSEHTDFGIVTVLWADQVAGLQLLGLDKRWHDVAPADGALLVNLGDLTARLTNDRWLSTLHRVKPPIANGTIKRRRSAAFFHDGNPDAVIETLSTHRTATEPASYPPTTIREHIRAKLAGSRQGTKNPAAEREAARVLAAAETGPMTVTRPATE